MDIKFKKDNSSEVLSLTGFDEIFSQFEKKGGVKQGQSLETRFKKLMNRSLTIFYKTSLKRNSSGETTLYIDSIKMPRLQDGHPRL